MDNPEQSKRQLEERFRQAFAALQTYMDDRENPLSGPQFVRLVDEFFAANRAMSKVPKKRGCVPEDKLRDLASPPNGSLFYERKMLNEAAAHCAEPTLALRFMAIESFLIHFRNLRDFLCPDVKTKNDPDNVIASDYDPRWLKTRDDWTPCSNGEQSRINKMLAHISYSRDLGHRWRIKTMRQHMMRCLAEFIRSLPTERQEWFKTWDPDEGLAAG